MHPNARRVVDAATAAGLTVDVVEYPEGTRTAQDAAAAVGCEVARIVKSLVFTLKEPAGASPDPTRTVLALVAGDHRLDPARLAAVAGAETPARRADADQVRLATGFPIGGVPPFGHHVALPTFLDESLLDHATVWAAAGTPRHVFEVAPADLVRVSGAIPADLAAP